MAPRSPQRSGRSPRRCGVAAVGRTKGDRRRLKTALVLRGARLGGTLPALDEARRVPPSSPRRLAAPRDRPPRLARGRLHPRRAPDPAAALSARRLPAGPVADDQPARARHEPDGRASRPHAVVHRLPLRHHRGPHLRLGPVHRGSLRRLPDHERLQIRRRLRVDPHRHGVRLRRVASLARGFFSRDGGLRGALVGGAGGREGSTRPRSSSDTTMSERRRATVATHFEKCRRAVCPERGQRSCRPSLEKQDSCPCPNGASFGSLMTYTHAAKRPLAEPALRDAATGGM